MPEEQRKNWVLWIVIGALVMLLFSCITGALAGGIAGYAAGKSAAQRFRPETPFGMPRMPRPFEPRFPDEPELPEALPRAEAGALVMQVVEGSPDDRAGIREGDIIVAVDGRSLTEDRALADLIARYDPGDEIELMVMRGMREREIEVALGRHPERGGETPWLGISYRMFSGRFRFEERGPRFEFRMPSPSD